MCGKEAELFKTEIEGTMLNVCETCAKFGTIIEKVKKPVEIELKPAAKSIEEEIVDVVVDDFAEKIRNKREKSRLKQEELAKKLGIKESLLHHIECGKFTPSIELAEKIERFLKIELIEQYIEQGGKRASTKSEEVTIGDMIKIKRR